MEISENLSPIQSALLGTSKSRKQKGKEYELGLFIFLLTGTSDSQHFDLGKEVNLTDKFDDVVARVRKEYTCLQAKLEDNPEAKLDPDVLIGRKQLHKGGFNLCKYYVSYLRIKEQLKLNDKENTLKKLIIFTNAKLGNITVKENDIELEPASPDSTDIDIITRIDAEHYKIKAATIGLKQYLTEYLKSDLEILSAELVKYFFSAYQFVYGKDSILTESILEHYYLDLIEQGIIEKENKKGTAKFTKNFIENNDTFCLKSPSAKELRDKLFKFIQKNTYGKVCEEKLKSRLRISEFPVFNKQRVKNAVDCPPSTLLLQAFSNCIIPTEKCMTLVTDHFRYYHTALVSEKVIVVHKETRTVKGKIKEVSRGKISKTFIEKDNSLTEAASKLRDSIETSVYSYAKNLENYLSKVRKTFPKIDVEKYKSGIKSLELKNTSPQNFKKFLSNVSFPVSNDFGQPKSCGLKIFLPNYKITENSMKDFVKLLEFRLNELNVKELFEKINNKNIRERFLEYYDFDPKHLEREIKDLVENWKNQGGANAEGWIIDSEKKKFVQKIETDICRPVAKYKTRKYKNDLNQKMDDFGLVFRNFAVFEASHFPEDKNIFYIKTESVLLTSMKMLKFLNERGLEDYIFINVEKLEEKEEITRITKAFQDDILNLLILSYEAQSVSEFKQILYDDLIPLLQNRKKRLFLITSASENPPFKDIAQNQFHEVSVGYEDTLQCFNKPLKILQREVTFQGKLTALSQLIHIKDKNAFRLIDAKALDRIWKNETVTIGCKPFTTSDLPGAYAHLSEEVNKKTFLTYLTQDLSEVMFVISGIQFQDESSAKNKLIENLELSPKNNKQEYDSILEKVNVLTFPYSIVASNKVIHLADSEFEDSNFMEFCGINSGNRVFWVKWDGTKFDLQQVYNPDFYVPRFFNKITMRKNVIKELQEEEDQFVFSGIDDSNALAHLLELESAELDPTRVFLEHDTDAARKKFNELSNTVHWLEVEKDRGGLKIVLRNSKGILANVRKYISEKHPENTRKERELLANINENRPANSREECELLPTLQDEQAVIIADDPGMGKSTTLVRFYESKTDSNKILTSHWVINVNLKVHLQAVRDIRSHNSKIDIDINRIKQFLSKVSPNLDGDLSQNLLGFALSAQNNPKKLIKLLITFDGFDEILDEADRMKVISLLKALKEKTCAKFWVTTRLQHQKTLEDALSTFSVTFLPLNKTEQKNFIVKFFKDRLRLLLTKDRFNEIFEDCDNISNMDKYTDAFLKKMESVFKKNLQRFIGTPLQLDLLLGSKGSVKEFQKWAEANPDSKESDFSYLGENVLDVYEKFIAGMYELYAKRAGIREAAKRNYDFKNWVSNCEYLAKSIFLSKKLNPLLSHKAVVLAPGLVKFQNNNLIFIHSTFGEYFISEVFVRWIEKSVYLSNTKKQKMLINCVLMNDSYYVIRSFINAKLSNKLEAIPEETLKEYQTIIDEELGKQDSCFNINNKDNETPLHIAAKEGNENIAAFLCSIVKNNEELLRTFVKARNKQGASALHFASEKDSKQVIVKKLVDHFIGDKEFLKCLIKISDRYNVNIGWTAFHMAAEQGYDQTVKTLLEHFSNDLEFLKELMYISDKMHSKRGWTALHLAAGHGFDKIVEISLKPFTNNKEVLKDLIKTTSDIRCNDISFHPIVEDHGWNALHLAAINGHLDVVEKLIMPIIDDENILEELIKIQTKGRKSTVLHFLASHKKASEMIKKLLQPFKNDKRQVLLRIQAKPGNTALHTAAAKGNDKVVQLLLNYFTDNTKEELIGIKARSDRTVFHLAVKSGDNNTVERVLESVTDKLKFVKMLDDEDNSSLHIAAIEGHPKIVDKLLTLAKNINDDWKTFKELIEMLNSDRRTAFDIATNTSEMRKILQKFTDQANEEQAPREVIDLLSEAHKNLSCVPRKITRMYAYTLILGKFNMWRFRYSP